MKRFQGSGAERLVKALDDEIRSRGRGAIRAVDRAAGYSEGWWQHRAESGDISARQLLGVLDHLGLDPVKFIRRALATENELELDRPPGEAPLIVARAWARVRAGSAGSGIGETYLETLDRQRYEEPAEVIRLVGWAIDHVELALLPRLLGVAGSAWRLMIQLDEAEHALHAGLEIARRRDDQKTFREMLQRLSYVVGDRGNLKEALRLAEVATTSSIRLGDRVGAAKALVDQGIWLSRLNQPKATTGTLKMALDWLPRSEKRNRCAALQIIGLQLRQLGELEEAQRYVSAAEREAVGLGEWANGKLTWLKAQILSDRGQLDEATRLLKIVLDTFRDLHHGETALATCDLVRAQLYRGQHAEAWVTAMTMTRLLEPVRHNKIVSAAIRDLLCCGQAGLTLALVEQVEARIESERQRGRPWLDLEIRTPEI